MKMNKRLATIAAVILLVLIPAFAPAWAASWVKLVLDPGLSSRTREDYQLAVDMVDILFTKYKIVVSDPITVVVTAFDDEESFIRALMLYCNMSRAQAEHTAKTGSVKTLGWSPKTSPVIVIRYFPPKDDAIPQGRIDIQHNAEAIRTLSHELFHQVQNQYGRDHGVKWLSEGSAELFQYMAYEIAGLGRVTAWLGRDAKKIHDAAAIPDTRQLACYDNATWMSLAEQKYPIYPMAAVMTYRLVGDNGFGKVLLYFQLLHDGSDPDKAFNTAFGRPMSDFLTDMDDFFNKLRRIKE
jgi:hypothetical protein